ncbi:MAG TPA: tetraacyldisaccharide 4'-kinase [Steroidobacteraceae bacterium]|nr:tetraacyldisaccharide 4'-kinase [Steroidobacteraceae bacterium]
MQQQLTELWYREPPRASLLQPLGWLYHGLIAARGRAYAAGWLRSASAGKPLVVVGNLTVGGTGKTPLTIWLSRELTARGLRVGIVARGYGGHESRNPRAVDAGAQWREVGDEALILARRSACPTLVGADRVAAARALAARVDIILADDGLQHLRLARDCEIVVIDGARGFGNGRLLPAGPLREPLARLAHADALVVNGSAEHASLARALPGARLLAMRLLGEEALRVDAGAAPRPLAAWRGERVHAVAGIGNPARFFATLRAHGIGVIEHAFPDHHPFAAAELEFADGLPVLMTEKDAVKCTAFAAARLWYVPVDAHFAAADAQELLGRVLTKVGGGLPQAGGQL